jgi:outer membrane lipoprotein SlyB
MEQKRQQHSVEVGDEQHVRRASRTTGVGALAGALVLGAVGLVVGLLVFDGAGVWAVAIAGAVAGGLLGAFWGGMASLDSPDPGHEPAETAHPLRDVESLSHEEGEGELER